MHKEERKERREFEKHLSFYVRYRCLHCVTNINHLCDLDPLSSLDSCQGYRDEGNSLQINHWKSEPILEYFEWLLDKQSLSSSLKWAWWIWRLPVCGNLLSRFFGTSSHCFSRLGKSTREIFVPFWRPSLPDPTLFFCGNQNYTGYRKKAFKKRGK